MLKKYEKLSLIIAPLLLGIITFIFYYPSLNYAFQFDDLPNITKYFKIRSLDFSSLFFSSSRWIVKWLNTIYYKIGGFNPFIYRFFNITFHIVSGILLFYFFYFALSGLKKRNYFKDNAFSISLFTSLFFLLHPVQTQNVSYIIQGQLEGLASLFVLLIVFCYLILSKINNFLVKTIFTIFLLILTALSTGTKEIAIVAPFLIILVDWFFIAQGDWHSYKKRIPLQLIIFIISFGFYFYFLKPKFFADLFGLNLIANNNLGNSLTSSATEQITPLHFFISQFKVILHYLFIFIWPFSISVEYDWKLVDGFFSIDCIVPLLILLLIFYLIIRLLRSDKINLIAFGFLWFFICIFPRSSFIPSAELLMDYKTYLASAGWLFILSAGILKLFDLILLKFVSTDKHISKLGRSFDTSFDLAPDFASPSTSSGVNATGKQGRLRMWRVVLFILFFMILGFLTYNRNKVWRTSLEFWQNIISNAPKARAFNNYGVELSNNGRFNEAIPYFKRAINLEPTTYWDPYTNLAAAYAIIGKIDLAITTLKQSLMINKYQPEAYNNLGAFFLHKEDFDSAQKCFIAALAIVPHYGRAMYNYGRYYLAKNDIENAWQYFKKACTQADSDHDASAFNMYAQASMTLKKYDEAIFAFEKVLKLTNNDEAIHETLFNLSNVYFLNNEFNNSIKILKQLIDKYPKDYRVWCNLIETYIEIQDFESAIDIIKKAKENQIYFEGIDIQEAKCLASLGFFDQALKKLDEILKDNKSSKKLRDIAIELRKSIYKKIQ